MNIPLSSPEITQEDIDAVVQVLQTSQLSLGPKLPEFEEAFARFIGTAEGVGMSSGTAGLQLTLQALGIGAGDEVIVPSFAFIAAANAIRHAGATPVFADIDAVSLNLTAVNIERVCTARTRAIMLVHTFGYPAELDPILALAQARDLRVVEDACEAIGAERNGRKVGSFGDAGVFSFYPNKPMTTGEGGMVVTQNAALAQTLRALRNQGRKEGDGWLQHSLLGFNYRLSEMNCALGISQLQRMEETMRRREAVAGCYDEALREHPDVELPPGTVPNGRVSWFAYVLRLSPRLGPAARDKVVDHLTAAGIGCRAYFPPIHRQPAYATYANPGHSLPVTEDIASRTLAVPFFSALSRKDVGCVEKALASALRSL